MRPTTARTDGRLRRRGPAARRAGWILLLGTWVGLLGCRREQLSSPEVSASEGFRPARTAELYFTTSVLGEIEPCGCTSHPLGGLPKLATVVEQGGPHRALVDSGALLLPETGIDELTRPQHRAKAALIARAYRRLGAAAINLAPSDLSEGLDLLESFQREGAVPLVSAVARPVGEGVPGVATAFVREIGGIRFGITGGALPEEVAAASDEAVALELGPVLRAQVESLRASGAEIIVVLAHLPLPEARVIAEAIPAIDLLIRGPGSPIESEPAAPFRVGPVIVAEAGRRGQYVGRARFALGTRAPERPLPLDDGGAERAAERARLERRIAALDADIERLSKSEAQTAAVTARKGMRARLVSQLEGLGASSDAPTGPHVEVTIIPLDEEIADDDDMQQSLTAYYQQLRRMNLERGDTVACVAPEGQPTYAGNAACVACHAEAGAVWRGTKHALAWETLESRGKHYDLTCVGCHTVGFRKPGGFCRLDVAKPFEDVGCENCHGPGSAHVAAPEEVSLDRAARPEVCGQCHVPEHSDTFDFESYLPRILGPGHGRPVDGGL